MGWFSKRKKVEETPAPKAAAAAPAVPAPAPEPAGIPAEIIAAISGAIAVIFGETAKIIDIRPVGRERAGRSAWSLAGLLENTRPF